MKSIVVKLMIGGLLVVALFYFCPVVMPMINQVFTPPAVTKPKPIAPPPGVRHLEKVENLVFELTNQARRSKNLAPLHKDAELSNVARAYSDDMLVRRFFDHTTPDGVSFEERISEHYPHWVHIVGENIWSAFGYNTGNPQKLAKQIVDDWMSSPGHRENILSPHFTHLGVGVSATNRTLRTTQEFVGKSNAISFRRFVAPWLLKLNKLCVTPSPLGEASAPGS
jgi:uncharacterized protein YkwD